MQKLSKNRKISNDVKFYALCKYRNGLNSMLCVNIATATLSALSLKS